MKKYLKKRVHILNEFISLNNKNSKYIFTEKELRFFFKNNQAISQELYEVELQRV